MVNRLGLESDLAVPPGEFLRGELEAHEMSQRELADRLDRPVQVVSEIVNAKKAITEETALALERVLGISAQLWLNLEMAYQLAEARSSEIRDLEEQVDWLKRLPVSEMEKRRWIEPRREPREKVRALLRFFGVASFDALGRRQEALGFRISNRAKVDPYALLAWVRKGELLGGDAETAAYDDNAFRKVIDEARSLTRRPIEDAIETLAARCAEAGVVFLVVPELPKVGANGVARWLSKSKALIQLNLRYRWADVFWFSFFHECAHVLAHQQRRVFIDLADGRRADVEEAEADVFAQDTLIPPSQWDEFVDGDFDDPMKVRRFARRCGIAEGIVVGRLQKEGLLPWNKMAHLKVRFAWAGEG